MELLVAKETKFSFFSLRKVRFTAVDVQVLSFDPESSFETEVLSHTNFWTVSYIVPPGR